MFTLSTQTFDVYLYMLQLLVALNDDLHQNIDKELHCVSTNSLNWTLVWLAPEGTQNCEFVCFHLLLQTISQMVKIDPMTNDQ